MDTQRVSRGRQTAGAAGALSGGLPAPEGFQLGYLDGATTDRVRLDSAELEPAVPLPLRDGGSVPSLEIMVRQPQSVVRRPHEPIATPVAGSPIAARGAPLPSGTHRPPRPGRTARIDRTGALRRLWRRVTGALALPR